MNRREFLIAIGGVSLFGIGQRHPCRTYVGESLNKSLLAFREDYSDVLKNNPFTKTFAWWERAFAHQNNGNDGPMKSIDTYNSGVHASHTGRFAESVSLLEQAVQEDPGAVVAWNNLAWIKAACIDPKFHDGPAATYIAASASAAFPNCAEFMDTLAAAHARCGRFDEAVHWEAQAIAVLDRKRFHERKDLFERGVPYTEPMRCRRCEDKHCVERASRVDA